MAPCPGACGRGCAPVPRSVRGRGLSERSEFRSPNLRDWGKGTPLGPRPGANGFGSFCRNKRNLVVRGRNPARTPPLLSFPQVFSGNPVSFSLLLSVIPPIGDPVVGAASHAARRGRQETDSAMRWRRYEDHSLPVVVGAPFDAVNGRRHEMPPLQRKGLRRHSRARLRKRGR